MPCQPSLDQHENGTIQRTAQRRAAFLCVPDPTPARAPCRLRLHLQPHANAALGVPVDGHRGRALRGLLCGASHHHRCTTLCCMRCGRILRQASDCSCVASAKPAATHVSAGREPQHVARRGAERPAHTARS